MTTLTSVNWSVSECICPPAVVYVTLSSPVLGAGSMTVADTVFPESVRDGELENVTSDVTSLLVPSTKSKKTVIWLEEGRESNVIPAVLPARVREVAETWRPVEAGVVTVKEDSAVRIGGQAGDVHERAICARPGATAMIVPFEDTCTTSGVSDVTIRSSSLEMSRRAPSEK